MRCGGSWHFTHKTFLKTFKFFLQNEAECVIISLAEADRRDRHSIKMERGSVVKRLRHRPFTAVTRVRFPSESVEMSSIRIRRCGSILDNGQELAVVGRAG